MSEGALDNSLPVNFLSYIQPKPTFSPRSLVLYTVCQPEQILLNLAWATHSTRYSSCAEEITSGQTFPSATEMCKLLEWRPMQLLEVALSKSIYLSVT